MPVEAPALLHELSETWRSYGHSSGQTEGTGVLRACAMTLIVAAAESDDTQDLGATLSGIMQRHPSRTILLRACPLRAEIEARTSVQCWMPFGRRQQICGEWIEIAAGADQLAEVTPLLLGLTVPDLPVVLWIRHTALAHLASLAPVLPMATRVIVDTSEATEPDAALAGIRSLEAGPWRLADLAWGRITRWRKAFAAIFRDAALCGSNFTPTHGSIEWAGERSSMPAVYLDAWLRASFSGLKLDLACCDPALPPARVGRIRRVHLEGPKLDILLERPAGNTALGLTVNGMHSALIFPKLDEADLLDVELGISGFDAHFRAALALARTRA